MRKLVLSVFMVAAMFACLADTVEEYAVTMRLNVPRIYDNMQSLGRRKYQRQTIKGVMLVVHDGKSSVPSIEFKILENATHKVNGVKVAYQTVASNILWHLVGDNRQNIFKTASVAFSIDANPSYNIGADEPDNTLILILSGRGTHKRINGYAAGQIGCGCSAYGHKSPTRTMEAFGIPGEVSDIAAVFGIWTARLQRIYIR